MKNIIIDPTSEWGKLDFFVNCLAHNTDITSILYKDKEYFERENLWINRSKKQDEEYDPDKHNLTKDLQKIETSLTEDLRMGYPKGMETPGYRDTVFPDRKTPIKYNFDFSSDFNSYDNVKEYKENKKKYKDLLKLFKKNNTTKIMFTHNIVLINEHGVNSDCRGGNYCQLYLGNDFYKEWKFKKNTEYTISDIAEGLFKLKSHKFDNNYELVFGIKEKERGGIEIKGDTATVILGIDHGS